MKKTFIAVLALCLVTGIVSAQADVIVGDINGLANWGSSGNIAAFSAGTTSCNIGTVDLLWVANTNQHPVIGQSMFRHKVEGGVGRFSMIGTSWLKHGFFALSGSLCNSCPGSGGSVLNPGCSDPYGASLNGSQGGLGPRFEVNAFTGVFSYPFSNPGPTSGTIVKRLQVRHPDLDPAQNAGAQYFFEGHYVTPDDAAAGNHFNNASYRPATVVPSGGGFNASLSGPTVRELPAIYAWQAIDPEVEIMTVDVPNEGRFIVGYKATDLGNGMFNCEFAVHNLNSHRSGRAFTAITGSTANFSNLTFHDVDYHSGDGEAGTFDGTDWSTSTTGTQVCWETDAFTINTNANALRWGTLYNFGFETDVLPTTAVIDLYRTGSPATVSVSLPTPSFSILFPNGTPTTLVEGATTRVDVSTSTVGSGPDPSTAQAFISVNGGTFNGVAMTNEGGGNFSFDLPAANCLDEIRYYASIAPLGGGAAVVGPSGSPANAITANVGNSVYAEDFNGANPGWVTTNDAGLSDGQWEAGVPVGGGDRQDPATDFDGSGACFLTDNVDGNSDVDGGTTTLTSPVFDVSDYADFEASYHMWLGRTGASGDTLVIEYRLDGGAWVTAETYVGSVGSWVARSHRGSNLSGGTIDTFQMRWQATDGGTASIVEAGLDAFNIVGCPEGPYLIGDVAAGNVQGSPEDLLLINGSAGGELRRVDVPVNTSLTFLVATPSPSPNAAAFRLYGEFGWPTPGSSVPLPFGLPDMAIMPCELNPMDPNLFVLAASFAASCPAFVGATPTPSASVFSGGYPFPITITFQAVGAQNGAFFTTNAVILRITP